MQIPFGRSAYRRDAGNLAEFRLLNLYVEKTKADEKGFVLQARPGLNELYAAGSGPIVGMFAKDGVLGGDLFALSGSTLFRGSTALGAVAGPSAPSFAATATELLITRGAGLYRSDGVSVSSVAFPDGADTVSVAHLGGFFYAVRKDTHRIYFSGLLDGEDWAALDFLSAERKPDVLHDLLNLGEELAALGSESVEFFQETGDADAPIARAVGRTLDVGVKATGCSTVVDGSLVWIANDNSVRTYDGSARRLSDASIDARIAASSSVSGFGWSFEGHVFFAVRLDTETLVVDAATGEWWEPTSRGYDNWRARCAAMVDGSPRFGDSESGKIAEWSGDEDFGDALERIGTAAIPLDKPLIVHNVQIDVNVGRTSLLTGQGSAPVVEIRASRDATATWGAWRSVSIGRTGEHRARPRINRWGMFDSPGAVFEFRCSDPVPFRVSAFRINEAGGGRAR